MVLYLIINFLPAGPPGQREELENMSREELLLSKLRQQGLNWGTTDIRTKRRLMRLPETGGAAQTKGQVVENTVIIGLLPTAISSKSASPKG